MNGDPAGSLRRRLRTAVLILASVLAALAMLGGCTKHTHPDAKPGVQDTDGKVVAANGASGEQDGGDQGPPVTDGLLPLDVPFTVKPPAEAKSTAAFSLVVLGPLGVAVEPAASGENYYRLGMKVQVRPGTAPSELQLAAFSVYPSAAPDAEDGRKAHADQASPASPALEARAAISLACKGVAPLDAAARSAGSTRGPDGGWSLDNASVKPFTGCLTFRYQGTPNGFAYLTSDHGTEGKASAWWPLNLPSTEIKTVPRILGRFDGSGNKVLRVSPAAAAGPGKVCWSMTGTQYNEVAGVAVPAGGSPDAIGAATGATGGCKEVASLPRYLQVTGSRNGDWSIIVTDF